MERICKLCRIVLSPEARTKSRALLLTIFGVYGGAAWTWRVLTKHTERNSCPHCTTGTESSAAQGQS